MAYFFAINMELNLSSLNVLFVAQWLMLMKVMGSFSVSGISIDMGKIRLLIVSKILISVL